jgi:hypothetical protein
MYINSEELDYISLKIPVVVIGVIRSLFYLLSSFIYKQISPKVELNREPLIK